MKTDDGQHLPNGEKKLPLSHHISSSITLQMYLSRVTRCGFQTDSPLICSSSILPPLFSTSRSVCPTSALSPPHRWSSITAKLEISAKFWLPSKSQFRGCDLSRKQWQWKGKKMLKEAVSVACRGWGYQICSLALRTSTWHLPENMLCAQNISNSFRGICVKMYSI